MRVGIFFSGAPPESGGGHTYEQDILISLLSVAHESHHEYVILSKNDMTQSTGAFSQETIPNIIVPRRSIFSPVLHYFCEGLFFSRLALKLSSLNRVIKKNRLEMVIFLSPAPEVVECPYITPVWDLQHRLQPWFPEVSNNGIWEGREKYYQDILKRASFIITGTSAGQNEISFLYGIPKDHIRILPLPTPDYCLSIKKGNAREEINKFHITGDYLLYPAQFWAHKNHINAIHALKILHNQYNLPLSLVLVGSDKGNLSYIQKVASDLQITPFIHYPGFVSREELVALYQNAFSLLFPTFFGPDNLPPLEAFALGCPVIASNVSGAEEQLGDAALLVNPTKPEEIAKAVDMLYTSHSVRDTLIEKGYARARQWTGKDFIRGLFSILDEFEQIRKNCE